jgi:hypothetical protein
MIIIKLHHLVLKKHEGKDCLQCKDSEESVIEKKFCTLEMNFELVKLRCHRLTGRIFYGRGTIRAA